MKYFVIGCVVLLSAGCTSIAGLLPRDHDPVMFDRLVVLDVEIEQIDCSKPDWRLALQESIILARSATWRGDPQSENLSGLAGHVDRMNRGGSKTFCELGKKTARGRIEAAKTAWEGR